MAKFLIEVPHEATEAECIAAIQIFLKTGSHFLSHADWGCLDGIHKAWITVDAGNKDEARKILPSAYRSRASIVSLNQFTLDPSDAVVASHDEVIR
jgi:hypothetical protein